MTWGRRPVVRAWERRSPVAPASEPGPATARRTAAARVRVPSPATRVARRWATATWPKSAAARRRIARRTTLLLLQRSAVTPRGVATLPNIAPA
ncbi:MAG: hypothetical protein FJ148_27050 [Deltaproteobacteria bacterium]|nr:hypothetical protein [Deltaproteobacteria bacterium]